MKETQLSQEELTQLKEVQTIQGSLITSFGNIEYQLQSLELQKEQVIEQLEALKQKEIDLGKALTEKYGNGSINLETGTFIEGT